jgi:hypothetical protein
VSPQGDQRPRPSLPELLGLEAVVDVGQGQAEDESGAGGAEADGAAPAHLEHETAEPDDRAPRQGHQALEAPEAPEAPESPESAVARGASRLEAQPGSIKDRPPCRPPAEDNKGQRTNPLHYSPAS